MSNLTVGKIANNSVTLIINSADVLKEKKEIK